MSHYVHQYDLFVHNLACNISIYNIDCQRHDIRKSNEIYDKKWKIE